MKPTFKLPLTGRCHCRDVVYKILQYMRVTALNVSGQSGSAFSLSLLAEIEAVAVQEGKPTVWARRHESGRGIDCVLCANCGTRHVPWAAGQHQGHYRESGQSR